MAASHSFDVPNYIAARLDHAPIFGEIAKRRTIEDPVKFALFAEAFAVLTESPSFTGESAAAAIRRWFSKSILETTTHALHDARVFLSEKMSAHAPVPVPAPGGGGSTSMGGEKNVSLDAPRAREERGVANYASIVQTHVIEASDILRELPEAQNDLDRIIRESYQTIEKAVGDQGVPTNVNIKIPIKIVNKIANREKKKSLQDKYGKRVYDALILLIAAASLWVAYSAKIEAEEGVNPPANRPVIEQLDKPEPQRLLMIVSKTGLNLRVEPDVKSRSLVAIPEGHKAIMLGIEGGWTKVTYYHEREDKHLTGYVWSDHTVFLD